MKERNIKKFRNKYLVQTKRYFTPEELIVNPPQMDVFIAGSDQVWNPYGLKSNKKIYFLPFGSDNTLKLSYAASFSVADYPDDLMEQILPQLKKFKAISVREKSGLNILKKAGLENGILLPDPTLLLTAQEYNHLIQNHKAACENDFFFYTLQKHQTLIDKIYKNLKHNRTNKIIHSGDVIYSFIGIESWLGFIKNSKFVVTNSFHGVVFSIILNTPFIVIPIEGRLAGMNNRIITLLERFELTDRIIWKYDSNKISELIKKPIIWDKTKAVRMNMKIEAQQYFSQNIKHKF